MFDVLEKALLASIGITHLTKEKIEETGRKIAQEANVYEDEAREFVDELIQRSLDAKTALERNVAEKVHAAIHTMDLPTSKDVGKLCDRIAKLELQLKKQNRHSK
jgi:polyhydroxyalkanoate synthesis regulator phasin